MDKNTRVTILHWYEDVDDLARTVAACLAELGYDPLFRHYTTDNYEGARFLFTYAPWGRLQRITTQLEQMPPAKRPFWIHWSTEDCPDLRLPQWLVRQVGRSLAWLDRLQDRNYYLAGYAPIRWLNQRFHKFRYVGIYDYAITQGLMGLPLEYSKVYADHYNRMGIPMRYARWGLLHDAHDTDFEIERDIDVLWIGTRRTRRRSKLLDEVIGKLNALGRRTYVVDGISHPPVYGRERSLLLRRAKTTLNLLPTWYDSALAYRWPLVAASRSLLVTEESLHHAPEYLPGEHYVAVSPSALVETICHYLDRPDERNAIVERAYDAVMNDHSILASVRLIMEWAEESVRTTQSFALGTNNRSINIVRSLAPSIAVMLSSLEMLQG